MGRKLVLCGTIVALVALSAAAQVPANKGQETPHPAERLEGGLEGTGVVQYDPGAPADVFHSRGLTTSYAGYYGNLFDTRNGAPLSPGTITGVSWYQGQGATGGVAFIDFAPPSASVTFQLTLSSPAPYTFNAIAAAVPMASPKFVGLALGFSAFGSVGGRSASTNGQGFHGQQRNWTGTSVNPLSGENIMLRIAGTIIVPVELMEFDVE